MTSFDHDTGADGGADTGADTGADGDRFAALVVATDDAAAAAAMTAIALAGGRLTRRAGWSEAAQAIAEVAPGAIVLVEAIGADDDVVEAALPAIAAARRPIVVALGDWQIDMVGASVLGDGAQLLCAPTMTDRVAALALALASGAIAAAGRHDTVAEGDAERLAALNAGIARIAEVLAELSRGDPRPHGEGGSVADRRPVFDAGPDVADTMIDPQDVRRTIRARRLRDQHFGAERFGGGLFEDPAWDMMLDLFAADLEAAQVSVSSLCIAAAVAPTTALRWIGRMTDAGLFVRTPDPSDRRRAFMTLSRGATDGMRAHLSALARAGLPLA